MIVLQTIPAATCERSVWLRSTEAITHMIGTRKAAVAQVPHPCCGPDPKPAFRSRLSTYNECRAQRAHFAPSNPPPLHPLSPGALADTGRAADRGAAAERGGW